MTVCVPCGRQRGAAVGVNVAWNRLLVLVLVMAQVFRRRRSLLVFAVRRSCSPQGLQRQKNQQEDCEPATHWSRHCRVALYPVSHIRTKPCLIKDFLEVGGYGQRLERADVGAPGVAGWNPTHGGLRGGTNDSQHLADGLPWCSVTHCPKQHLDVHAYVLHGRGLAKHVRALKMPEARCGRRVRGGGRGKFSSHCGLYVFTKGTHAKVSVELRSTAASRCGARRSRRRLQ